MLISGNAKVKVSNETAANKHDVCRSPTVILLEKKKRKIEGKKILMHLEIIPQTGMKLEFIIS